MRMRAAAAAFAALSITLSVSAEAQRTVRTSSAPAGPAPIELGVDGQISFGLDDQGTSISLPAGKVRAGFFLGDVISVEPALGFQRFSSGGASSSQLVFDVSMLYHLGLDRNLNQFYVRPVVGLARTSFTNPAPLESRAFNDISLGVAGGIKMPLMNRVAFRSDAELRHTLADGTARPSFNALNLNFGLSFYTR